MTLAQKLGECGFEYVSDATVMASEGFRYAAYDLGERVLAQLWPSDRSGSYWIAILNLQRQTLDGKLYPMVGKGAMSALYQYAVTFQFGWWSKRCVAFFEAHPWFSPKNEDGPFGRTDPDDVGVPGIKQFLTEFPFCQPKAREPIALGYGAIASAAAERYEAATEDNLKMALGFYPQRFGPNLEAPKYDARLYQDQLEAWSRLTNNTVRPARITASEIAEREESIMRSLQYRRNPQGGPVEEEKAEPEPEPISPYLVTGRKIEI